MVIDGAQFVELVAAETGDEFVDQLRPANGTAARVGQKTLVVLVVAHHAFGVDAEPQHRRAQGGTSQAFACQRQEPFRTAFGHGGADTEKTFLTTHVVELQLQILHTGATAAQKTFEFAQESLERKQQHVGIGELETELEMTAETLGRSEPFAWIGQDTERAIELALALAAE